MDNNNLSFLDLTEKEQNFIKKLLRKYLMGIVISRDTGNILYYFQVDPLLRIDLFSQFIAALTIFGEELGKIKRIIIEGHQLEMSSMVKNSLIITAFFRPDMVKDYLEEEAEKCLDQFENMFEDQLSNGRCNQDIYKSFDRYMWALIQDYLIRIDAFDINYLNFMR